MLKTPKAKDYKSFHDFPVDWHLMIRRTVQQGIRAGELLPKADPETVATVLIATLEGALMLTKLYGDRAHLLRAKEHLEQYVESLRQDTS